MREQINGNTDIKTETIKNGNIALDANIAESKLALTYSTVNLHDNSVRIDEHRTIQENVFITFPATGFKMKDAVNGKTYIFTLENGVLKATEEV